jgi:hypothetical protein
MLLELQFFSDGLGCLLGDLEVALQRLAIES